MIVESDRLPSTADAPAPVVGMPWAQYRTVLLAACIGNVLEWYDFALYGGFAAEFGTLFFPPCEMSAFDMADIDFDQASALCSAGAGGDKHTLVRAENCPMVDHCCAWDNTLAGPIDGMELGDCVYDPVEKGQLLKSFGVFAGAFIMRPVGGLVMGSVGDKYGRKAALQLSIALMLFPSILLAILPTYDQIGYASTLALLTIRLCQGVAAGGELVGSMLYTVESAPGQIAQRGHGGGWSRGPWSGNSDPPPVEYACDLL